MQHFLFNPILSYGQNAFIWTQIGNSTRNDLAFTVIFEQNTYKNRQFLLCLRSVTILFVREKLMALLSNFWEKFFGVKGQIDYAVASPPLHTQGLACLRVSDVNHLHLSQKIPWFSALSFLDKKHTKLFSFCYALAPNPRVVRKQMALSAYFLEKLFSSKRGTRFIVPPPSMSVV